MDKRDGVDFRITKAPGRDFMYVLTTLQGEMARAMKPDG